MEFKGTPGPWAIKADTGSESEKTFNVLAEFNGSWGKWIADAKFPDLYGGTIDETMANAIIISKGPEMLAMLNEAANTICKLKLSMLVHPDCVEGSEFDDFTTSAQETEDKIVNLLKEATTLHQPG